jgi:hypothetical protein
LELSEFDTPFFRALPLSTVFDCLLEKRKREGEAALWREYMALIIPIWGGKETDSFDEIRDKYRRRSKVTTQEELDAAEEIGRATAAAFGLL